MLTLVLTGCAVADREPTAPDGLTHLDKRGAAAAAAFFATVKQATLTTGDTHTWREHTDRSCRACTYWANLVAVYDIYGRPLGADPPARVNATTELAFSEGRWRVMSWRTVTSFLEGAPGSTTQ